MTQQDQLDESVFPGYGIRKQVIHEVDPETISMWTGLFDKNGDMIFGNKKVRVFNIETKILYQNGAWGYLTGKEPFSYFVSFADNGNFEWENSRSQHIEIVPVAQ